MTVRGHVGAAASLGVPLIGSNLALIAIGISDTVMVGWYDVKSLAAIVLAGAYYFVIFIFGTGFGNAVMPLVAEAAGAGNDVRVRRITRMGIWISLLFSVITLPMFMCSGSVLKFLGQDPEVAGLAQQYLRIAGLGVVPSLLIMVLKSYLSALERTAILFWGGLVAVPMNIIVNYCLIFGHWGLPELGIRGAAVASLSTQMISVIVLTVYISFFVKRHALFTRLWRPDWPVFIRVFRLGWPIGLTMLAQVGLFAASTVMVGWVGLKDLAAHGIAIQLASITFMIQMGFSGVATVRSGRAFGSGDAHVLRVGARVILAMAVCFAILAGLVFFKFPEPLTGLFLASDEPARPVIIATGSLLLVYAAIFQLVDAFQSIAMGLLRGLQDARAPMLIAAVSYWLVGCPTSLILSRFVGWGTPGVWIGLIVGLACAAILLNYRFWAVVLPRKTRRIA